MIGTIADKKVCGGASGVNTGKLGCLSLFGAVAHLIGLQKGLEIDSSVDFNEEYIRGLVQTGKAVPIVDATAFEDVSAEDSYSTNAKGIKRLNVKGLPEYKLTFEEGHEFYRELAKLESYKSYDFIIGDTEGNWMLVKKSNGNFQGFTAGHTTPELTQRKVEGGDAEMKSLTVQFLDRLQWDQNYAIIHSEDVDFTPSEIPAINGTEISFNTAPADGDTVLVLDVVLSSDRSTRAEGLEDTDFVVTVNSTTPSITNVTENADKTYSVTIDTALSTNDKVKVDHFHGGSNTVVADSNGVLFRNTKNNEITVV